MCFANPISEVYVCTGLGPAGAPDASSTEILKGGRARWQAPIPDDEASDDEPPATSQAPITSRPFFPITTGGTSRGIAEKLARPWGHQGRMGMQPYLSRTGYVSSTSACGQAKPGTRSSGSRASAEPCGASQEAGEPGARHAGSRASADSCGASHGAETQEAGEQGVPEAAPEPVFAAAAWSLPLSGTGALHADKQRADMRRLAEMAGAPADTPYRRAPPQSVAEALAGPDAELWRRAIKEEVDSCLEYEVWTPCSLPPDRQALPCHFIFSVKRDGRHKARLVAGGHRQVQGLDFYETYASVCGFRTVRMIAAIAAREGLHLRQFDICSAFLNGTLEEEVYLRPPAGVDPPLAEPGKVLRLRRALYGLRQAGRAWQKCLEDALRAKGFVQSNADPALWILHGENGAVMAMFYVDDGLVAARTAAEADALVDLVGTMFKIRRLGEPDDFLGIRFTRDWDAGTITLDQEEKARALAAELGVAGERRRVPMSPNTYASLRAAALGAPMADMERYQSVIGSLQHLAQCTRPDIALAVNALSSYNHAPTQAHYDALVDVVRYVGSTAERGITYGHTAVPVEIWCDANFAACADTRRSTTGWIVVMYGGAVSWASKKQPTTAASTMDAEYQACGAVAREGLSLIKALEELSWLSDDFPLPGPLAVFCYNKAALSLCNGRKGGASSG
ncbi:MAG: hypothetical protein RL033_2000 [Pseudomonadota bacterium]